MDGWHICINGLSANYSWWERDAQGIPLVKVCAICKGTKLAKFRKVILTGYGQNDVDEQIEPEE